MSGLAPGVSDALPAVVSGVAANARGIPVGESLLTDAITATDQAAGACLLGIADDTLILVSTLARLTQPADEAPYVVLFIVAHQPSTKRHPAGECPLPARRLLRGAHG